MMYCIFLYVAVTPNAIEERQRSEWPEHAYVVI